MPVASTQVDALKKFIGQGEIYYNVGKPTSFAAITFGAGANAKIPQKQDGTTNADSVGLTSGPATLEYKPEFKGVEVEQAYGEVAPRVTKETVTLKFKCAEATYTRIKLALQTGTLTTDVGAAGDPTDQLLSVGGKTFFSSQCIALVSDLGTYDNAGTPVDIWEWVAIYEAMSVDGLKLDWKRGETRMVEVTITGYADVTRSEGDQLFQIGQLEDPTP
jgi:hypothetical protein